MSINTIENGYFIFTMMPSLHCNLRCPHCYLSLEQRQDTTILSLENIALACNKIDSYYSRKKLKDKTIILYWYGGEPTDMGMDYFTKSTEIINSIFSKEKGYTVKHIVLSALNTMGKEWFPFLHKLGDGYLQTSYDGLMRGRGYLNKWERKVKEVNDYGFDLATITVVNREILNQGAKKTFDYLTSLNIVETSWLPFMWNEQNDGDKYNKFAPTMNEYSDFMIELSEYRLKLKEKGVKTPFIGQQSFINSQSLYNNSMMENIAGQTLFLLPNGDFVLPDYKNKYQEYMKYFGNIIDESFEEVLNSKGRREYLRKQIFKNNNKECLSCEHTNKCIMEFWKDNREKDDCFGAKKYVQWVVKNKNRINENGKANLA